MSGLYAEVEDLKKGKQPHTTQAGDDIPDR